MDRNHCSSNAQSHDYDVFFFKSYIFRDIWLDKIKFSLDGAIGHFYGTTFEVKNGQMHKIQKTFKEAEVLGNIMLQM